MCGGLSDVGRQQCERLAERLARTSELAGCVLYASQFRRAQETAKLIAPVLGNPDVALHEGFGELDWGPDCDGLTFAEIVERLGAPDWDGDPEVALLPGAESSGQMRRRITAAIDEALAEHPGRIIVVCTHGGAIDVALRYALGIEGRGQFDLWTTNTSLTTLSRAGAGTSSGRWRIERYNDAAHLQ